MSITSEKLAKRLKLRKASGTYMLELRGAKWGDIGRVVVRQPGAKGWPHKGPSTGDKEVAEMWLKDPVYPRWVNRRVHLQRHGGSAMTVREAIEKHLERLKEQEGEDFSTYRNRSSSLVKHTKAIHEMLLVDVDYETMAALLDSIRVRKRDGSLAPPQANTLRAIRTGMSAVWHECLPGKPPWRGLRIGDERKRKVRDTIKSGQEVWSMLRGGAYNQHQVRRVIVAGHYRDMRVIAPSPPLRASTLMIGDAIQAFLFATGMRITEACMSQWHDIDWERGIRGLMVIRGTKTSAGLRVQPVQDALRPWLNHLKALYTEVYGREPTGEDYIIQTSPRGYRKAPASRGMVEKVSEIQRVAGLKKEGRATHVARSSWVSNAVRHKLEDRKLKLYVGHGIKGSRDISDVYMEVEASVEESDYQLMDHLPSPEQVRDLAKSFEPAFELAPGAGAPGSRKKGPKKK